MLIFFYFKNINIYLIKYNLYFEKKLVNSIKMEEQSVNKLILYIWCFMFSKV